MKVPFLTLLALLPLACGGSPEKSPTTTTAATTTTTISSPPPCEDADLDGFFADPAACGDPTAPADCDDGDPAVFPGAVEVCGNGKDDDCDGRPDSDEPTCKPPVFSFALLADPHIAGQSEDRRQRLGRCVAWVNDHRVEHGIEIVFVLGDIGWGDGELAVAKQILDALAVPYVPLIGDNEIQFASEKDFDDVFGPQFATLAGQLDGFQKPASAVENPVVGGTSYFQNCSFDHRGVHFIAADWPTRRVGELVGEQAELHDFPGGTWPWFEGAIADAPKTRRESIVMLSHNPMHRFFAGAFDDQEFAKVTALLAPVGDYVFADFAGHYHSNTHNVIAEGGYEVFMTDDIAFDDATVRVVGVHADGEASFEYSQLVVAVPP